MLKNRKYSTYVWCGSLVCDNTVRSTRVKNNRKPNTLHRGYFMFVKGSWYKEMELSFSWIKPNYLSFPRCYMTPMGLLLPHEYTVVIIIIINKNNNNNRGMRDNQV